MWLHGKVKIHNEGYLITMHISYTSEREMTDIGDFDVKPGTHQADADELVATKADCGVGSRQQRLGPKLPWHTKPMLDTRRPSSMSVLRLSRALVRLLNSQSEWSDGPTDRRAPSPIQQKKLMRTNFSQRRRTHWENVVGRRTKTARRPTVSLVCSGLLKHSLIIVNLKTSDKTHMDGSGSRYPFYIYIAHVCFAHLMLLSHILTLPCNN